MNTKQTNKNIIICLDGTGNQFGKNNSNIIKLYRMLKRVPGKQVTYYDPGVGTMGDQLYKTGIARKVTKVLGMAFGRGVIKNVKEAYAFLMEQYEDGDKVFIFGFSRGAYTARVLAAFIKECGLLEKGAMNLFPYAMKFFQEKPPKDEKGKIDFHKERSRFRTTYGRELNHKEDPLYPGEKREANYQLRTHFLGLFDTVKSYGWAWNQVIFRNEEANPSVLNVRHALAIDERRAFFRQMHWRASKGIQSCKEVWFTGSHSDVGGGYSESKSGLAKVALEWMVHEAITYGMIVDHERYGKTLQKELEGQEWKDLSSFMEKREIKYSSPDPKAAANESLKGAWKLVQLLPMKLERWEVSKLVRTMKSEEDREDKKDTIDTKESRNHLLIHESVIERIKDIEINYNPKNLQNAIERIKDIEVNDKSKNLKELIAALPVKNIEKTIPTQEVFKTILLDEQKSSS